MQLPKVPKPFITNTGEDLRATQKTIDNFIKSAYDYIIKTFPPTIKEHIICDSRELCSPFSKQETDDRITYLKYKDQIAVVVLATRTEFNYIQYTFFSNLENLVA